MKKFLSVLILVIITFSSCDGDSEINLGEESLIENQSNFQVDFDGQTFIADYAVASIVDGVTIIKAIKASTSEVVVIVLNKDAIGSYDFTPNENSGSFAYKKNDEEMFITSDTSHSGNIEITQINKDRLKLFGKFSFVAVRLIPKLDANGNQVLDGNDLPVFDEEIKEFKNGLFSNIALSLTNAIDSNIDSVPDSSNDTFFMKIDGEEFIETTLTAERLIIDGVDIIRVMATNDGSNHIFKLEFPASVSFNNLLTLQASTTNSSNDAVVTYRVVSLSQEFGAYSGAITNPLLTIISHDLNNNKVTGTFEFSGHLEDDSESKDFTEGAFSVTYTD